MMYYLTMARYTTEKVILLSIVLWLATYVRETPPVIRRITKNITDVCASVWWWAGAHGAVPVSVVELTPKGFGIGVRAVVMCRYFNDFDEIAVHPVEEGKMLDVQMASTASGLASVGH